MTFWELFIRLLPRKPKAAFIALYWHLTRRRVRARNRLLVATEGLPFAYDLWVKTVENSSGRTAQFREAIDAWVFHPQFSVALYSPPGSPPGRVNRSISSIERQIYPGWSLVGVEFQSMSSLARTADGDYIVFLRAGDQLAEIALYRFAETLQSNRTAAILYGDEDLLDRHSRRSRPWFKPHWNEEMFLAVDYLSSAVAIDRKLVQKAAKGISGVAGDNPAFMLAVTALANGRIVHVPHIISHVDAQAAKPEQSTRLAAVAKHVGPLGGRCVSGPFGTVKVDWPLPKDLPLVSIIVPTRDRLDLLQPCLDGVLDKTDYGNFEILVLDNESVEERTLDFLARISEDPRVRVIRFPGPYNFSHFNNFAARQVNGPYLCLLNNDTEVVEPAWLTEMMRYAVRPDVGAVGAKLLYDDGTIQHAGVVIGLGEAAGHAHRNLPADQPGYFRMPHITQFMSAVTAACMLVDKKKFLAVGGLDETLAVAFNDVDLCLKLQKAGFRNVYVPHAVLIHHESKTRGNDVAPHNIERYRRELRLLQGRWGTKTYNDPQHNPNLDRYSESFVLNVIA